MGGEVEPSLRGKAAPLDSAVTLRESQQNLRYTHGFRKNSDGMQDKLNRDKCPENGLLFH